MEEQKKEQKTTTKKVKINRSGRSSKPKPEAKEKETPKTEKAIKISFDSYFQLLLNRDSSVQPHHKVPMKSFFKKHGAADETLEKFDEILKKY